jgi:LAO/AO transport system kinase
MIDVLVKEVLGGSRRALARLLTLIENEREGAEQALAALFPYTGRAWVIGVTGAPGTGKSSLVNVLAKLYRAQNQSVGIIAVDPTSPFSGGAILGDRIRMRDLAGDSGVFIRSMATRGNLGGLSRATRDAVRVLDAAGFAVVVIETVGAGQSEVDIVRTAQTTLVVEAPGLGDEVQAIKAGILEIADILVVNKADRPGANNTVRSLKAMLELGHPASRSQLIAQHGQVTMLQAGSPPTDNNLWIPPIIQTVATEGAGVEELAAAIEAHRQHLANGELFAAMERQRIRVELYDRLQAALMTQLLNTVDSESIARIVERIQAHEIDPQSAVHEILSRPTLLR